MDIERAIYVTTNFIYPSNFNTMLDGLNTFVFVSNVWAPLTYTPKFI